MGSDMQNAQNLACHIITHLKMSIIMIIFRVGVSQIKDILQRCRRLRRTLKCQQAFSVQKKQQKVIGGRLKQPVKIMEVQGNKIGTPCSGWSLEIQKQEPNHKTPVCEEEFWRKSLCDSVTNQTWEMGERKTQEDESSKSWAAISGTDHFSRWRRLNRQQAQGRG